jgi:hypothetical protein
LRTIRIDGASRSQTAPLEFRLGVQDLAAQRGPVETVRLARVASGQLRRALAGCMLVRIEVAELAIIDPGGERNGEQKPASQFHALLARETAAWLELVAGGFG